MLTIQQTRRRSIVACIAATTTVSVTLGISWPLLALVLERQGVAPWLNGLSASSQMVAVLAVMPVVPALIGGLGLIRVIVIGVSGMAVCLALLPMFPSVWAWFPIRFALGLCEELVFIAGDIWINQLALERTRGRLIGTYGMFLHGGFAVGPLAIVALGSDDWTVLYLGLAIVLFGLMPLAVVRGSMPPSEGKPRARLRHYVRVVTLLMVAGLMFGLIGSSTESLLPIYALAKGLDEKSAAFLLTLFATGAVLGQLPAGWLADHFPYRRLLIAGSLGTAITLALMPSSIEQPFLIALVMLGMGACLGSFYIVAMTMMGRQYRGADLIGVNTSFVFLWGVGAALGPGLSGGAMTAFGPDGMPLLGIALCAAFLFVCLARRREGRDPTLGSTS